MSSRSNRNADNTRSVTLSLTWLGRLLDLLPVLKLLIGLLVRRAANINLFGRLITLRFNLGTAAIGFYKVATVGRPIFVISSANSSGSLVLFILSAFILSSLTAGLKNGS